MLFDFCRERATCVVGWCGCLWWFGWITVVSSGVQDLLVGGLVPCFMACGFALFREVLVDVICFSDACWIVREWRCFVITAYLGVGRSFFASGVGGVEILVE